MRFSNAQLNTISRCPREYVFKYILKYPDPPGDALLIGRVFHKLTEGHKLQPSELSELPPGKPWEAYFRAMIAGYNVERARYAPQVFTEVVHEDETVKLIVDEVAADSDGSWWIVERKTASKDFGPKADELGLNLQTNLYVSRMEQIAEHTFMDPGAFQGVYYFVSYKPMERRKKNEGDLAYGKRFSSSTEGYIIDKEVFREHRKQFEATWQYGLDSRSRIEEIYSKSQDFRAVPYNTGSCRRFGKPCPYFDKCHTKGGV